MKMRVALSVLSLSSLFHFTAALAQWQPNGVGISVLSPGRSYDSRAVTDGAGGAIVVWTDGRNGAGDIYVQRVNASGVPQWTPNGVALCTAAADQLSPRVVTDGAGGAIVTWLDGRSGQDYDVYIQRVDASGIPQWTANGVALCTAVNTQDLLSIAADGAGGAIVAWRDDRVADRDIYAGRVNASGLPQWTADGVALCTAANDQDFPSVAADGAGGAIVVWTDSRAGLNNLDIYAQRVNASGTALWTVDGSAICTVGGNQQFPWMAADGTGGDIMAWEDSRNGDLDIYAQRVNSSGARQWSGNGVDVCVMPFAQTLGHGGGGGSSIATDGAGGAFITWTDLRNGAASDIYAQRINNLGSPQWFANGVVVSNAINAQANAKIIPDGSGNAIVTWDDHRGADLDVYAQRVVASGGGSWTFNGVPVCTAPADQSLPLLVSDGFGSAIVAWDDGRQQCPNCSNIYAERIEFKYGYWGGPESVVKYVTDMPLDQGKLVEIHWTASQHDNTSEGIISRYSIWRMADAAGAEWEMAGEQPATAQPDYSFLCPTLEDATPGHPANYHFKVVTHADALGYEWDSNIVDGFSLDNLAPPAPTSLSAERLPTGGVLLHWHGVSAPDLDNYAVYRWKQPGPQQFLMSSEDTTAIDADASNEQLRYTVAARDVHGNESPQSNEVIVDAVTGVGGTPTSYVLSVSAYPNPFNPETTIRYTLPARGRVTIDVFDARGAHVARLVDAVTSAGAYTVTWNGHDDRGNGVSSGVFFARLTSPSGSRSYKMTLLK